MKDHPQDLVEDRIHHVKEGRKYKDGPDHHGRRRLHLCAGRSNDLPHLAAHVREKALRLIKETGDSAHSLLGRGTILIRNCYCLCHKILLPGSASADPDHTTDNSEMAGALGFEPRSSVLETDSLTVELTPLYTTELLGFFMVGMLAAGIAELRELQTASGRLLVLRRRVIPLLAYRTL
jgi:hypothetical protein